MSCGWNYSLHVGETISSGIRHIRTDCTQLRPNQSAQSTVWSRCWYVEVMCTTEPKLNHGYRLLGPFRFQSEDSVRFITQVFMLRRCSTYTLTTSNSGQEHYLLKLSFTGRFTCVPCTCKNRTLRREKRISRLVISIYREILKII